VINLEKYKFIEQQFSSNDLILFHRFGAGIRSHNGVESTDEVPLVYHWFND
jgi:hypothetical protein